MTDKEKNNLTPLNLIKFKRRGKVSKNFPLDFSLSVTWYDEVDDCGQTLTYIPDHKLSALTDEGYLFLTKILFNVILNMSNKNGATKAEVKKLLMKLYGELPGG